MELANRIGIQWEKCGHETLYFFDRTIALGTYFTHIIKAVFDELSLAYREKSKHNFFLPDLNLTLRFIDGGKEQLNDLDEEYIQNRDLILVVPGILHQEFGGILDGFFQVLPLARDKIKNALTKIIRQRINYIPAYSSGL